MHVHPQPASCEVLLQKMISVDSENRIQEGVAFVEGPLIEELEQICAGWGLATRRLEIPGVGFNLLVTHESSSAAPWLLFDSHLDTVGKAGMTVAPLGGEIRDGRIYGRGACDTKGTGAAMLWALRDLAAEGPLDVNVAILFSIDEEVTKTGIRAFAEQQLQQLPWQPRGAIVGEPTHLKIVAAHSGSVRWEIETRGITAHSSIPSHGRSAITDMVRVIELIEREYVPSLDAAHELAGSAACSINIIRGGTHINVIPDTCTISVDRRTVPGEDASRVLPEVERLLDRLRRQDPDLAIIQHTPRIDPAFSPESSFAFASAIGTVLQSLQMSAKRTGAAYGTHASNLAQAGVPTVVLGPGDIAKAHTADEYLALDQLELGVKVYRAIMSQPGDHWPAPVA